MGRETLSWPWPWFYPELTRFETAKQAKKAHGHAVLRSGLAIPLFVSICGGPLLLLMEPEQQHVMLFYFPLWIAAPWGIALLFRQRMRKRLRKDLAEAGVPICIKCGYDLRGQVEPRCPECGSSFDANLVNPGTRPDEPSL